MFESVLAGTFDATNLPCADFGLLDPLKRSPEYREIRRLGAKPQPFDAWIAGGLHYFVFEIPAHDEATAAFALFTMLWEQNEPLAALVVTPLPIEQKARVNDLRQSGVAHEINLS